MSVGSHAVTGLVGKRLPAKAMAKKLRDGPPVVDAPDCQTQFQPIAAVKGAVPRDVAIDPALRAAV